MDCVLYCSTVLLCTSREADNLCSNYEIFIASTRHTKGTKIFSERGIIYYIILLIVFNLIKAHIIRKGAYEL